MSKTRIKTPELGPGSHRIRVRVDIDGQQAFDIDEEVTSAEVNISSPVTELPSDGYQRQYGPSGYRSITISTYDRKRDALLNLGKEKHG